MFQSSPMSVNSAQAEHHGAQEDVAPLPLIRCPICNNGVTGWYVSASIRNPGRHYYKCEHHAAGRCGFWKWENEYIDYIRARWGHIFAPAAAAPLQNDETRALLLNNQRQLNRIMMVAMAILAGVVLLLAAKM